MAAAYAAPLSLSGVIEDSLLYHSRQIQPIFLDKQLTQIQSLRKRVTFLLEFLEEGFSSHGGGEAQTSRKAKLERRIAEAAHAAEDIIESHVVDYIKCSTKKKIHESKKDFVRSKRKGKKKSNNIDVFSQDLRKVTKDVDSVKRKMCFLLDLMKEKRRHEEYQDLMLPAAISSSKSSPPTATKEKNAIIGLDEETYQIMDKLTSQTPNIQVIPITGMGGIGKTTLAKNVYDNPLPAEYFDIRAWVTVSQEYNVPELLFDLLNEMKVPIEQIEEEHQLGEKVYKHLCGRRYLIIVDDLWSTDAWDRLKLFLPDNKNGSRIIVTTRLENVAINLGRVSDDLYKMNFLDEDKSWRLLCEKVFNVSCCPLELEEIGKKIATSCRGLPLSIVVIGGLLAKSGMKWKYWEYVADNLSSIVNVEDNRHCLRVLSLSYSHLPIHLKPCFLYMSSFPEDHNIHVSRLVKLWVADRFMKPKVWKTLLRST